MSDVSLFIFSIFFFFNDTATTEIYTLSLHDALPIYPCHRRCRRIPAPPRRAHRRSRSEEHTSELQSPCNLVCRLLLEKKKEYTPTTSNNRGPSDGRIRRRSPKAAAHSSSPGRIVSNSIFFF